MSSYSFLKKEKHTVSVKTKKSSKKFAVPSIMIFLSGKSSALKLKFHGGSLVCNMNETLLMFIGNSSKKFLKSWFQLLLAFTFLDLLLIINNSLFFPQKKTNPDYIKLFTESD